MSISYGSGDNFVTIKIEGALECYIFERIFQSSVENTCKLSKEEIDKAEFYRKCIERHRREMPK